MSEPRYVADPFEDDAWRYPETDIETEMLNACGRKYYPTRATNKKTKTILSKMVDGQRKYPDDYIKVQIAWAKDKNKGGVIAIKFASLLSAIRNPDNLASFNKKGSPKARQEVDTSEYYDLPDY